MKASVVQASFCLVAVTRLLVEGAHGGHHHAKKAGTAGAVTSGVRGARGLSGGDGEDFLIDKFKPFPVAWQTTKFSEDDHSHNWCMVKEKILSGEIPFTDALKGRNVSVLFAIQPTPVSVEFNASSGQIEGGMSVEVFEEVAKRSGFSWKGTSAVTHFVNRTWVNESDDKWLRWAVEKYDVVDWFTITPNRMALGLHFGYPFINMSPHLVGKVEIERNTMWDRFLQCFSPFSFALWAMVMVGFLISAGVYLCLEGGSDDLPQKTASGGLGQAFFLTFCQFTGAGGFAPATPAGKLYVMSISFLMMLLVTAYTANLASEMIIEKVSKAPIQSVEDAVTRNEPICVRRGSPFFRMMRRRYPGANLKLVDSEQDKFPAVARGDCIAAVTGELWWELESRMSQYNPNCEFYAIGRNIQESHGSFVTQATSATCKEVVMDVFTYVMHRMYLDGFLEEVKDNYVVRNQDVPCSDKPTSLVDSGQTMKPRHMIGIFMAHGLVSILCIFVSVYSGHFACPGAGQYSVFSDGEEEDSKESE